MDRSSKLQSRNNGSLSTHNHRDGNYQNEYSVPQKQQRVDEEYYVRPLDHNGKINYHSQNVESESPEHLPGDQENQSWENASSSNDTSLQSINGWYGPHDSDDGFDLTDYLDRENQQIQDFEGLIDDEIDMQEFQDFEDIAPNEKDYQKIQVSTDIIHDEGESSEGHVQTNRFILNHTQLDLLEDECNRGEEYQPSISQTEHRNGVQNIIELWDRPKEPTLQSQEQSKQDGSKSLNEKGICQFTNLAKDKYHWLSKSYESLMLRRGCGRRVRERSGNRIDFRDIDHREEVSAEQISNRHGGHGKDNKSRTQTQERARENGKGEQELSKKLSKSETCNSPNVTGERHDFGDRSDPSKQCQSFTLRGDCKVKEETIGEDKCKEILAGAEKRNAINSNEDIFGKSCSSVNERTLQQKKCHSFEGELKSEKRADLHQKQDEIPIKTEFDDSPSLPKVRLDNHTNGDSSDSMQSNISQSERGKGDKKRNRDEDEGTSESKRGSNVMGVNGKQCTTTFVPLRDQTVKCEPCNPREHSTPQKEPKSTESGNGEPKISFKIRKRGIDTRVPRRVQKSRADNDAAENSNEPWLSLSERIFQVHEKAEGRYEKALVRVKKHLENEIRHEERRENKLQCPTGNSVQPCAVQKKSKGIAKEKGTCRQISKILGRNGEISQDSSVPPRGRTLRRDEGSEEQKRKEKRTRSCHRKDSNDRYSRSRSRTRRRRDFFDDRYSRSRTRTRRCRDSSDDRYISRMRSRYRGDFLKDRHSRRRDRSYSQKRPTSRSRSRTKRTRIGTLGRLSPIKSSRQDSRSKDRNRRHEPKSRVEQQRDSGVISPSSKSSQSSASRQTTSVNGEKLRCRNGESPRCDYTSTDEPISRSSDDHESDRGVTGNSNSITEHQPLVAYSPSHADSIDFETVRFEFLDSPLHGEESLSEINVDDNSLQFLPDTPYPITANKQPSQNISSKEVDDSLVAEIGLERSKGGVETSDGVGVPPNTHCPPTNTEEIIVGKVSQLISDEGIGLKGQDLGPRHDERGKSMVGEDIERSHPLGNEKNSLCNEKSPTVCTQENLPCKKALEAKNPCTIYTDRVRQFALLLILLKREMREGTKLNMILHPSEVNDSLESILCFERKNPETGEIEVNMFVVRYFFSLERRSTPNINYEMLFKKNLNIGKLCESYNTLKNKLSAGTGVVKKFTILTNLGLNNSDLKNDGVNVMQGTAKNCKSIFVNKNCKIFQRISNKILLRLASVLVGAIDKPEPVNFTPFLKTHHLALVRERIVKISRFGTEKSGCTGLFHQDFIENRNLSQSAKELRCCVLSILKRNSLSKDLTMNLPEAFGKEFVNTYSSLNTRVNLDGLENPAADFFDCIEFEKYADDIKKTLLEETGIDLEYLKIRPVVAAMEGCLLKWIESKDVPMDHWLDAVKGAMSQELIILNHIAHPQLNLEFQKHDMLSKLEHRLFGVSSSRKLTIQTDYAFLVSAMIEQVANRYLNISAGSYHCMRIKLKFPSDLILHIHNLIRSSAVSILVIDCSDESLNVENMKDIFSSYIKELDSLPAEMIKKVVIVGPERTLPRILKNVVNDFLLCTPGGIEILSEKSQNKLLHYIVRVRNNDIEVRELLDRENIMNLLRKPQFLAQFLIGKLQIDDVIPAFPVYDQDTYLPRHISLRVVFDANILNEPFSDVLIVRGISKENLHCWLGVNEIAYRIDEVPTDKHDARLIVLEKDPDPDFDEFLKDGSRNIHLFNYKNGYLIWSYSVGSISNLIPHRLENVPEILDSSVFPHSLSEIAILKRSESKIVMICGDSGTGKSTYLHDLATSAPQKSFSVWHLKINLSREYFKDCGDTSFKDVESTVAHIKKRLEISELVQELFSICLLGKSELKIILFFDGFDELPSNLLKFASQMISQLQKSFIESIFVTVRPGANRKHLESKLGLFSHNLNAFTQSEECWLLNHFWKKKGQIQEYNFSSEDSARRLLTIFHSIFSRKDFGLVGNLACYPLYLKMLAEIHKDWPRRNFSNIHTVNSIYDFYKTYVLNAYPRIFYREIVREKSLQRLLPVPLFESLEIDEDKSDVTSFELPDELRHITFAEFAVIEWLKTQVASQDYELVKILQCIDSILDSASPVFWNSLKIVFSNLEGLQDLSSFINLPTASAREAFLQELTKSKNQDQILPTNDEPSHLNVVERNCVEYVKPEEQDPEYQKLSEDSKTICSEPGKLVDNGVEVEKRVQFEAIAVNVDMVYHMALTGADLSGLDANFLRHLSNAVARELEKLHPLEKSELRIIAEKLFLVVPDMGFDATNRETLYPRLLPYFFANGRLEVVQCLMRVVNDQKEKNKILQEKFEDKTLLDYVNESKTLMNDLQRRDIIKYLLEEIGLEMKDQDKFYVRSVLNAAIRVNHPKTFKYFVSQYPGGYMGFLESSLKSSDFDAVSFLVYYDQKMKACKIRDSILHTAVRLNVDIEMIEFIINKSGVDMTNNLRETPLCVAIKSKADISIIKYLVSLGANINAEDDEGLCPWCYILVESSGYSTREQDELIRCLMELKRDLILPPPRNLDYDYDRKRLDIIRKYEYFKNPASYNLNYQSDDTLRLHSIIKSNKIEDWNWGKFLVTHGADVRLKDSCGKTPLHIAVEYSRKELAKFLLQRGAVFSDSDNDGNTPLHQLTNLSNDSGGNQGDILSLWKYLMESCDGTGRTLLHVAAETNNIAAMKKMMDIDKLREKGELPLNFDARDFEGNAPIHLAVRKDHDFVIELLISGGANHEMRDYSRKTPLCIAREMCQFSLSTIFLESIDELFRIVKGESGGGIERVRELVEENCQIVHARDSYGMTALHWTVQVNDNASIVRYLIEKSDSIVDAVDYAQRTALDYAAIKNHSECVKVLLEASTDVDLSDEDSHQPVIEEIITID